MPFKLLGLVLLAGALYLGWLYRDDLRRAVHRATADSSVAPPPAPREVPSRKAVQSRLDALKRGTVDSVALSPAELGVLVDSVLERQSGGALDSLTFRLGDDRVIARGRIETAKLPRAVVGPLAEWVHGSEAVEVSGLLLFRRVGQAEWRVDEVRIGGVPLPRAVWERLLSLALPAATPVVGIPLAPWVSGIRVTPEAAILYGTRSR